jgi:hypothetical protein
MKLFMASVLLIFSLPIASSSMHMSMKEIFIEK